MSDDDTQTPGDQTGSQTGSTDAGGQAGHAAHGSLSEEALKLAETLQTWLSTGSAVFGSQTGVGNASECKVCPLCQMIGVVNNMRPEVIGHLTEAGFALAAAFKAATESSQHAWTGSNRPPVQHIKVT